jgi:hypothetical protein
MFEEDEELHNVSGWLLIYAVIKIGLAAITLVVIALPLLGNSQLTFNFKAVGLSLVGVVIGLITGIAIVRQSRWAIPCIMIDLALNFAFLVTKSFQSGLRSPGIVLREMVQFAIFIAWVEYFRTSKRVRNALGRNLFGTQQPAED